MIDMLETVLFAIELPILCGIFYIEWLDWKWDTDLQLLSKSVDLLKKNNEKLEEIIELLKRNEDVTRRL